MCNDDDEDEDKGEGEYQPCDGVVVDDDVKHKH